jgi:uncharacterized cupredoxin-like copper-binding protein
MRLCRCSPHPALLAMLAVTPLAAQSAGAAGLAPWVAADSAARTATITLEVTAPAGSPSALLNGYREGGVQVVVPLGWTVTWDWRSADSAGKHSLVVMAEREKLPTEGGRPAFTNAMSRSVTAGLAAGQSDRTTFEAEESGWYWLLCGVPGHALAGEWIGLRVDAEATTAGVRKKREE